MVEIGIADFMVKPIDREHIVLYNWASPQNNHYT
jgi:hypothetical protein